MDALAQPAETPESLVADGAVTVRQAAAFTGLGKTALYDAMDAGRLAYLKVGKRRLIPRRALVKWLAAGLVDATRPA